MKKRTAFIFAILFLSSFFLKDKVYAGANRERIPPSARSDLMRDRPRLRLFAKAAQKHNAGNYQGAIELWSKYINKYPSPVDYQRDAYYYRASSKVMVENYDGAISDLSKAIEIYPEYTAAFMWRGLIKREIGDIKGACSDANKTVSLGFINYDNNDWIKNNCKSFK